MDEAVIQECYRMFPDAESEIEAVDLTAQSIFKKIRSGSSSMKRDALNLLIQKYNYLNQLRRFLLSKRIEETSSFITRN